MGLGAVEASAKLGHFFFCWGGGGVGGLSPNAKPKYHKPKANLRGC